MRDRFRTLGVLVLATVLVSGCEAMHDTIARLEGTSVVHGTALQPALARPNLTLTSTDGRPYDFATETRGRVTFLTFGYTHCPDICPVHMATLAAALKQLTPQVRRQVTVVFVTTDPTRDSLPRLRQWLDSFDSSFVGLRGSEAQILAMERAFHVRAATTEPLPGGGYTVDHSAQVFAFTPDDSAHVIYMPGVTAADYVHDIPRLMRNVYR